MKIVFKDSFLTRLENQIDYISKDSPKQARTFKNDLLKRIKEIAGNPYRYRQSIYFEDNEIRDLIEGLRIYFNITLCRTRSNASALS